MVFFDNLVNIVTDNLPMDMNSEYNSLFFPWDCLGEYIDDSDKFISRKQNELDDKMSSAQGFTGLSAEEKLMRLIFSTASEEVTRKYEPEIQKIYTDFPQIIFRSLFISTYCLLESSIGFVCYKISHEKGDILNEEIRKRNLVEKVSLITRFNLINVNFTTKNWSSIQEYMKIRNDIVHNSYLVEDDKFEGSKFCKKSYLVMREFFDYIYISYKKAYPRHI